jgi:hypothetical protein
MNKRSLTLMLTLATTLALPAAARADWDGWHEHHDNHHYHEYHRPHSGFEFIVSQPQPVYYIQQPQPVYINQPAYYPQPVMAENNYCREFTRTIFVGGCPQQGYGNACLQPDGSWREVY